MSVHTLHIICRVSNNDIKISLDFFQFTDEESQIITKTITFFASCPKGIEELLLKEIHELGIQETQVSPGGILFKGQTQDALKVILLSRLVSRVFKQILSFEFKGEKELYNPIKAYRWNTILTLEQTFKIQTLLSLRSSYFYKNSLFLSQVFKDALVDSFRETNKGLRPSVDTKNPGVSLLLRIDENPKKKSSIASIYIDLCGKSLSDRGYRQKSHTAPLRENLAAAILMSMNADFHKTILFDSMCGTGTFVIEAALIANNIPASYLKIEKFLNLQKEKNETQKDYYRNPPWAFLNHLWFKKNKTEQENFFKLTDEFHTLAKLHLNQKITIFASDIDTSALSSTRKNITAAKLENIGIKILKDDATKVLPPDSRPYIFLCNPPYGERMGEEKELEELYYNLGENLKKNWKSNTAYIFTSEKNLRKKISLQTSKRTLFYNGQLECRLLKYDLY